MNAGWRCRLSSLALASLLAIACATTNHLKPVDSTSPRMRAQHIYDLLLSREGRTPQRDPRTLSGYPEAPVEVAQQLEALAASKQGEEREALFKLARALGMTGAYSRAMFRTKAQDITIKYRAIARTDAQTAHAGWNSVPIGFYEVWVERGGKAISEVNEYDIIQREVVIDLVVN